MNYSVVFILITVKKIAAQEPTSAKPPMGVSGPNNFVEVMPMISFIASK